LAAQERATFAAADLSTWSSASSYDLVTASFLHSPVALSRPAILRAAAAAVGPRGHLLVITHAAPPAWADPAHTAHHTFLTAAQEVDALGLDPAEWSVVIAEERQREVDHPEHGVTTLLDGVVLMQRR
jgi:hypothetical protein